MSARSLLFVPGDSPAKIAKSLDSEADIVIFDLEDAVTADHKSAARERVREVLTSGTQRRVPQLWVRINPLQTPEAMSDLVVILHGQPDGIVLPKVRAPDDVVQLARHLEDFEQRHGLQSCDIRILPIATETPASVFTLGSYGHCGARLYGLTWGAEDLSAAVGASANQEADGSWTPPYQLVRSLCLFGASAAGVPAIDTLYANFRNADGLRAACGQARRDGFEGKLAIHPDQVTIINECFTPSAEERAYARRVVELFARNPGVAALALDGRMLDIPHLRQAQKILSRSGTSVG